MNNKINHLLKIFSLTLGITFCLPAVAGNNAELLLSAMEGNPESQAKIAPKFKKLDSQKSYYWYKQAARQGVAYAQFRLGYDYLQGVGTKVNKAKALEWWSQAAAQGHALSQYNVGLAYYEGIGTDINITTAEHWFNKGALQGNRQCIQALKNIKRNKLEKELIAKDKPNTASLHIQPNMSSLKLLDLSKAQLDQSKPIFNKNGWANIQHKQKLAVWSYKQFVTVNADNTVTFTGNNVRTRLTPDTTKNNIVTELNKGTNVTLLKEEELWVQIELDQFSGWVQKDAFTRKNNKTKPSHASSTIKKVKKRNHAYAFKNTRNDNDWLFGNKDGFTVIIDTTETESSLLSALESVAKLPQESVKILSSKRQGIEWKHVLYGNFANKKLASKFLLEHNVNPLSIVSLKLAQQQRCTSWKRTIPVPKQLKKYCLPAKS